ncbi:MAG: hypothetical protein ACTFAK_01660 [Candidatus Electronema sp. VV]
MQQLKLQAFRYKLATVLQASCVPAIFQMTQKNFSGGVPCSLRGIYFSDNPNKVQNALPERQSQQAKS